MNKRFKKSCKLLLCNKVDKNINKNSQISSVPPRTNGASVPNDFYYIKPLCSPLLCVTYLQSSNLKRYHSKLLKTHGNAFSFDGHPKEM